jgi:hypothetical protein
MKNLIAMLIMLLFVTACATPQVVTTTQFVTTTTERDSVKPAAFANGALDVIFGVAGLLTGNPIGIIGGTNQALVGGLKMKGSTRDTIIIPAGQNP